MTTFPLLLLLFARSYTHREDLLFLLILSVALIIVVTDKTWTGGEQATGDSKSAK